MDKSLVKINCEIEVLSENLTDQQILDSIKIVSSNPELTISNRLKNEIKIKNQEVNLKALDPLFRDYFKVYKKD